MDNCNKQLYPRGIMIIRLIRNTYHMQPKCIADKRRGSNPKLQIPNATTSISNNYSRNRKHLECETG
jgi:hypothetical protein